MEQKIKVECCATVGSYLTKSLPANLIGLSVVVASLLTIAPLKYALIVVIGRLVSISLTQLSAFHLIKAIEEQSDLTNPIWTVLFASTFGGASWASILYAVPPQYLLSLPGMAIVITITLGLSIITLKLAALHEALTCFMIAFLTCVVGYPLSRGPRMVARSSC